MSDLQELCKNQKLKPDKGFTAPIRTRRKCSNPAFADHRSHRIGWFKREYWDQGTFGAWLYVQKCVNCEREFDTAILLPEGEPI